MSNYIYPIVKVKTEDDVELFGYFSEPEMDSKILKLHIHGTAGSFYFNNFYPYLLESTHKLGIAQINANTRGSGIYELAEGEPATGASLELFEDCLKDIDAWIEFALNKGYSQIILEGHSFGTEKAVYYMNNGKYKDKIISVILLGFSDSVGTMQKYLNRINKDYSIQAKNLVAKGKGYQLIDDTFGLAGEIPISAQTYLTFVEGSECSKALPLRNGKDLSMYRNIKVPILGVIGDNEEGEYTIIPISDAIKLLRDENSLAEVYQISNCNHLFSGKEENLADKIEDFIRRRIL